MVRGFVCFFVCLGVIYLLVTLCPSFYLPFDTCVACLNSPLQYLKSPDRWTSISCYPIAKANKGTPSLGFSLHAESQWPSFVTSSVFSPLPDSARWTISECSEHSSISCHWCGPRVIRSEQHLLAYDLVGRCSSTRAVLRVRPQGPVNPTRLLSPHLQVFSLFGCPFGSTQDIQSSCTWTLKDPNAGPPPHFLTSETWWAPLRLKGGGNVTSTHPPRGVRDPIHKSLPLLQVTFSRVWKYGYQPQGMLEYPEPAQGTRVQVEVPHY